MMKALPTLLLTSLIVSSYIAMPLIQASGVQAYGVAGGLLGARYAPTLSGGEFDGFRLSALPAEIIVSVRNSEDPDGSELVLWSPNSGLNLYNIQSGELSAIYNPTLSGGDFDGYKISELTNNVNLLSLRNRSTRELALFSDNGISFYNIRTGEDSNFTRNIILEGGDYDGLHISELPVEKIIGLRDTLFSELAVLGPSGVNLYDVDIGVTELGPYEPSLTGGDYAGSTPSELINNVQIVGIRDTLGSELSTFLNVDAPPYELVTTFGRLVEVGPDQYNSIWLGYFFASEAESWYWVLSQGWWYFSGTGLRWVDGEPPVNGGTFYFYDKALGTWLWTNTEVYPWLYSTSDETWLYWLGSDLPTRMRWFYSNAHGRVFSAEYSE